MCLAVAAEVIRLTDENTAEVSVQGVHIKVSTALLSAINIGDYVLVHAGFAIEKIDENAAVENIRTWRLLHEAGA